MRPIQLEPSGCLARAGSLDARLLSFEFVAVEVGDTLLAGLGAYLETELGRPGRREVVAGL